MRPSSFSDNCSESMKGTLIPALELGEDLVNNWIELQQANPDLASPYFHPAFTRAIAAARHDVEVAVLQSEGKIVAFFPFQREQGEIGRPVGGIISDYHGLICAPDFQFSPTRAFRAVSLKCLGIRSSPCIAGEFCSIPVVHRSHLRRLIYLRAMMHTFNSGALLGPSK